MMAFSWKLYENMKVIAVCLLLFFFILIEAESNCTNSQNLETGEIRVSNPNFPHKDEDEYHCIWQTTNLYSKVNCSIDIPVGDYQDCTQGNLSVQFAGENTQTYCGFGTFVLEGTNATIKLDLSYHSQGEFVCEISTEKQFDEYNCKCGWKKVTRIVGGNETGVNEYSMMCGLVDSTNRELYCGCTIISHQHILTAAHCIQNRDTTKIGVVVGEHDVTTGKETNATKLFYISNCEMHHDYKDMHNDIAVCKIIGNITYSAEVGPVCLPFQHSRDSFGGNIATALGWGLLAFGGSKATTLQEVELNIINLEECKQSNPNVTDRNICTYTSGKDTCQMDSGGPVLWENPTTHNIILVGITSIGVGCASNEPAIDTRTGAFIDWIVSKTPDVQYCKVE